MFKQEEFDRVAGFYGAADCASWVDFRRHIIKVGGRDVEGDAELRAGTKIAMIENQPWPGHQDAMRKAYSYGTFFYLLMDYATVVAFVGKNPTAAMENNHAEIIARTADMIDDLRAAQMPIPTAIDIETVMEDHVRPMLPPESRGVIASFLNPRPIFG